MNGLTNAGSAGGGEGRVTLLYESGQLSASGYQTYDLPDSAWMVVVRDTSGYSVVLVGAGGAQTYSLKASWISTGPINALAVQPLEGKTPSYTYKVYGLT